MNKIIEIIDILESAAKSNYSDIRTDASTVLDMALYGPDGYIKTHNVDKLPKTLFEVTYPQRTFMDKIRGRNKNPLPKTIHLKESSAETLRQLAKRGALGHKTSLFLQRKYEELAPAIAQEKETGRMAVLAKQAAKITDELRAQSDKLPTNIATHVTAFLPQNKNGAYYIPSTAAASNNQSVRATVHMFIDGIVTNYHGMGYAWELMPYVIIAPLAGIITKNGKPMIFNGEDTFWAVGSDGLHLPDNYRLVRPAKKDELGDELYKIFETETIYKVAGFTDADIRTLLRGCNDSLRNKWEYYSDIKNLEDWEKLSAQKFDGGSAGYIQQKRMEILHELSRNNAAQQTSRFWYNHDLNWNRAQNSFGGASDYFQEIAKKYDLKYGDKTAHYNLLANGVEDIYRYFLYEIEQLTYLFQHPKTKLMPCDTPNGPGFKFSGHISSEFFPRSEKDTKEYTLDMNIAKRLWEFDNARDMAREIENAAIKNFRNNCFYEHISPEQKQNVERAIQKMTRTLKMRLERFLILRPKNQSLETFIKSRTISQNTNIIQSNNER